MRIAHYGTFDVQNYGDSLFPVLVRQQFLDPSTEVIHVSPVGGQAYSDVPSSIGVAEFEATCADIDAVIVGGGNILHSRRTPLGEYRSVQRTAYPNLWAHASKVAGQCNAPLIFNAPGVPQKPGFLTQRIMRNVLNGAAYVAVRDSQSAKMLEDMNLSVVVNIVPDTALLISEAIAANIEPDDGYVAVHINQRYMTNVEQMAETLDKISSSFSARIELIGIGACHGDGELAENIAAKMKSAPTVLAKPRTVAEVANSISGSRMYIGSSLHGFITACSYGVPAALVANNAIQHKFLGLLNEVNAADRLFASWNSVVMATSSDEERAWLSEPVNVDAAKQRVREHWSAISALVGETVNVSPWSRLPHPGRTVAVANVIEQAASRGGRAFRPSRPVRTAADL